MPIDAPVKLVLPSTTPAASSGVSQSASSTRTTATRMTREDDDALGLKGKGADDPGILNHVLAKLVRSSTVVCFHPNSRVKRH